MIKSMTGFGKSFFESSNKKYTIELRSLNSKQLDINMKIPALLKEKEFIFRNEISKVLERGKVDVIISEENAESDKYSKINSGAVKNYYRQFVDITNELGHSLDEEQIFQIIMRFPDVLKSDQMELEENIWENILNSFKEAVVQLDNFRLNEGKVLYQDVSKRVQLITEKCLNIEIFEKERIELLRNKILQNLNDSKLASEIDKNRFEQELIYYLEKLDITEEKVRLKNHCHYFLETGFEQSSGKKLQFIAQEIGREINTLGNKSNHFEIQKLVVEMKDELEKIKEQLMNIL